MQYYALEVIYPKGFAFMRVSRIFPIATILLLFLTAFSAEAQQKVAPPLPEIPQLMREVREHQKHLEKVRENYTYSITSTTEILDKNGRVKKTITEEKEIFFVNGQAITRTVKKDGQPLSGHDLDKESERVTKEVEKASKPGRSVDDQKLSISRLLEIVEVRNPRRENYRGRPTIVFDFAGRRNAKTHGKAEDAYKKLYGTFWVDEADRQIAHCDATFDDNFHFGGGFLLNIEKGSSFHFDQAPVNGELWLQDGEQFLIQARALLAIKARVRITERDYNYKRFHVETQQVKDAKVIQEKKS
jgi:hypothetical protein